MTPSVSVVIPVGPGHAPYLSKALASVEAQTVKDWEVIVVDDQDFKSDSYESTVWAQRESQPPYIRVFPTEGKQGAGHARNMGLSDANAPWIVFLDADDELMPRALEHLLDGAQEHPEASYIYGDWWNVWEGKEEYYQAPEYEQLKFLRHNLHVVTALYPTKTLRELGGFDESLRGYEDWELALRLAMLGKCGKRVPFPIMTYRIQAGFRREWSRQNEPALITEILGERYRPYVTGEARPMACCGQLPQTPHVIAQRMGLLPEDSMSDQPMVRMEYVGSTEGTIPYQNPFGGTGAVYRGGVGINRYADVHPVDVDFLKGTGAWREVKAGAKHERPRKDMEALIVDQSPVAQAAADQAAADALIAAGDVETPKRKPASKAKEGE